MRVPNCGYLCGYLPTYLCGYLPTYICGYLPTVFNNMVKLLQLISLHGTCSCCDLRAMFLNRNRIHLPQLRKDCESAFTLFVYDLTVCIRVIDTGSQNLPLWVGNDTQQRLFFSLSLPISGAIFYSQNKNKNH